MLRELAAMQAPWLRESTSKLIRKSYRSHDGTGCGAACKAAAARAAATRRTAAAGIEYYGKA
eukprot:2630189-Prymnesium_polylepis.1